MARVSVDYYELEKLRQKPIVGAGLEGICYEYDSDHVLKIFNYLLDARRIYFEGLQSKDVAFPIDIYEYLKTGLIQAVLTKRFFGHNLKNGFAENLEIDKLLAAYNRSRQEILKYPEIKMEDISAQNVLFDKENNAFKFIETTSWIPNDSSSDMNLKKLDDLLMQVLCVSNLNWKEAPLIDSFSVSRIYNRWSNNYDILDNNIFPEFINNLREITEKENGKVKTIGELKRK